MLLFVATKTNAQWIELGGTNSSPFNNYISSIATDANGNVYAGGEFTDANSKVYVARWNGTAWVELSGNNSRSNRDILSIATDAGGDVYAGGAFFDANYNAYVAGYVQNKVVRYATGNLHKFES